METTIFGFKINPGRRRVAYTDAIAGVFMCSSMDYEYSKDIITKLAIGEITVNDIRLLTEAYGRYESYGAESDGVFINNSSDKYCKWFVNIGVPSDKDFDYLRKKYRLYVEPLKSLAKKVSDRHFRSARQMADEVKRYIKGQDDAIDRMAVNFFLHVESRRSGKPSPIKTPLLLMGPTGVGKSEIYRRFGQLCDCPVIRINSNEIVPTSWRGTHITDIIGRQVSSGCSIEQLRHAIIVFHEFDKITEYGQKKVGTASSDIVTDMMRDLMRLFETGHSLTIENHETQNSFELAVDDLMVVFDGAFYGIEKIIAKRLNMARGVGFTAAAGKAGDATDIMKHVSSDDLIKWGFMPELIGRIGEICVLNPLTPEIILSIMTEAEDSVLAAHIDYCSRHNISLRFNNSALRLIAERAHNSGLGFRNVKTLLARCMNSLYFDLDTGTDTSDKSRVITINKDFITRQLDRNV